MQSVAEGGNAQSAQSKAFLPTTPSCPAPSGCTSRCGLIPSIFFCSWIKKKMPPGKRHPESGLCRSDRS